MVRTKELYQQDREAELSQRDRTPTLEEIEFDRNSRTYCEGCGINWSQLPTEEGEGEEQYTYCPVCRTDEHLRDGKEGAAHTMNPIRARITDQSGNLFELPAPEPPPVVPAADHVFDEVKYNARLTEQERTDNRAIAAYIKGFESGGQSAGEKAFREELKK